MTEQESINGLAPQILIYQSSAALCAAWAEYLTQQGTDLVVRHTVNRGQMQRWLKDEPAELCALDLADPEDVDLFYDLQMALPGVQPLLTAIHPLTKIVEDLALTGTKIHFMDPPFSQAKFYRAVLETREKRTGHQAATAEQSDSKTVRFTPPAVVQRVTSRISGNLKVLLPDLVQLKCLTGSSCVLEISAGHDAGEIFFDKGNIVHCQAGSVEGVDALVCIFTWTSSHFQVRSWRDPKIRSIRERWESLLLNVTQRVDEAKQNVGGQGTPGAGTRAA